MNTQFQTNALIEVSTTMHLTDAWCLVSNDVEKKVKYFRMLIVIEQLFCVVIEAWPFNVFYVCMEIYSATSWMELVDLNACTMGLKAIFILSPPRLACDDTTWAWIGVPYSHQVLETKVHDPSS